MELLLLRISTIHPGPLDEWRAHAVPPRRRPLEVLGAWAGENTFTLPLGWAGEGSADEATTASHASPERAALDPDPARHIAEARQIRVRPVQF